MIDQEEINLGNKLISEFVGYKRWLIYDYSVIKYHNDWNKLMLAVDKIELLDDNKYVVQIAADRCTIFEYDDNSKAIVKFNVMFAGEKIWAVYRCIVEFIKWHNNGK
jgi:hypothetical protein